MDAVAEAADISRPGLYFLFSGKDELFHETMRQALETALGDARTALAAPDTDLQTRVVAALDANMGRYVGTHINAGLEDLLQNGEAPLHAMYDDYRVAFLDALTEALAPAAGPATGRASARQIAEVLQAAAEGWKHRVADRSEYVEKLTMTVEVALPPSSTRRH